MGKKTRKTKSEKVDGRSTKSIGGAGSGKTPLITLRVDDARKDRWLKAAGKKGETLSQWLRRLADEASGVHQ